MVRAAVDFLRDAWPFFDDDFFFDALVEDELFLPADELEVFGCVWLDPAVESCASSAVPCKASSTARR